MEFAFFEKLKDFNIKPGSDNYFDRQISGCYNMIKDIGIIEPRKVFSVQVLTTRSIYDLLKLILFTGQSPPFPFEWLQTKAHGTRMLHLDVCTVFF